MTCSAAARRRDAVVSRLGARQSTSIAARPAKALNHALIVARPRPVTRGIAGLARATAGAPARAQVTWIGAARPVLTAYATRELSSGRKGGGGRLGALFGLAAVALGKFKYVLVALKLTKLAPVLSMVASSLAYSAIFGPAYGCGMVGLIFVHECGHILAMRYYGLPFSPMLFIPFVGAVIQMQKLPATAAQSAVVALAGPVVGGVAAGATAFAGHATGSQLLMALGDWGFMINLFNLLPIGGLDGGRVADAFWSVHKSNATATSESSRRPPRHRREHPTHWLICAQVASRLTGARTGRRCGPGSERSDREPHFLSSTSERRLPGRWSVIWVFAAAAGALPDDGRSHDRDGVGLCGVHRESRGRNGSEQCGPQESPSTRGRAAWRGY